MSSSTAEEQQEEEDRPSTPPPSPPVLEEKKTEEDTNSNDKDKSITEEDEEEDDRPSTPPPLSLEEKKSEEKTNNDNLNDTEIDDKTIPPPPPLSPTTAQRSKTAALESATSNYVYIPSKDFAWIPARLLERNDEEQTATLSVPVYANENSIQSDGGRHAKYLQKVTLDLNNADSVNEFNVSTSSSSASTTNKQPKRSNSTSSSSNNSAASKNINLLLQNVNDQGRLVMVPDMVDLPFLHEAAILYNLKDRHLHLKPYTRTGDIIIACNPYQWLHPLYSMATQREYAEALVWKTNVPNPFPTTSSTSGDHIKPSDSEDSAISGGGGASTTSPSVATAGTGTTANTILDPRRSLEPHIYETAALAYRGLAVEGMDQSILVSGESGAGKTESVKICLHHIAAVQQGSLPQYKSPKDSNKTPPTSPTAPLSVSHSNESTGPLDHHSSPIVQRVLDSNPLLEAFGNAKTVRNDNSSRFGKYVQLQFDAEDPVAAAFSGKVLPSCKLAGSVSEVYLLEKSRVVHHAMNEERTYHIFYQLLAADEDIKCKFWSGLEDTDQESFWYVGYSDTDTIEGLTDRERFQSTLDSLALIGIVDDKLTTLLRAICIVLQLGNIILEPDPKDETKSVITSTEDLEALADVMGIKKDNGDGNNSDGELDLDYLTAALTIRTVTARNEEFKVPLRAATAKDSVDAFAKEIYAKTFLWLVRAINDATCAERNYADGSKKKGFGTIGLLDIFGFESFEINRFEQLCINYANEKLQQKFTQDIFRSVQMEYENEGIELDEIKYDDNTDVLDLVEGRMGLLAFLNEECVRPGGSDKGFVSKAATVNKDSSVFFRDTFFQDVDFGVKHYAGEVVYNATGFVTKNMDTLPIDLHECAARSSNAILSKDFSNESMMNSDKEAAAAAAAAVGTSAAPVKKPKKKPRKPPTPRSGAVSLALSKSAEEAVLKRKSSNLIGSTVWTKFKGQLTSLMANLSKTRTRYIRCIKPNSRKEPLIMEHLSTIQQLRCAGVVAAVTISRSAFPNRLDHEVVLDRFKSLWEKGAHHAALDDAAKEQADALEKNDARIKRGEVVPVDNSLHHSKGGSGVVLSFEDPLFKSRFVADRLLTSALQPLEDNMGDGNVVKAYVLGKTRTYFRAGALEHLEAERLRRLGFWAIDIQRIGRAMVARRNYHKLRGGTITMQALVRRRIAWTIYLELRRVAIAVQCWNRCIMAARMLVQLRRNHSATLIQTHWRMAVAATLRKENIAAAIVVQTMVRGSLQRPKFRTALHERREEAKLENQVLALQRKLEEAENRRLEAERLAEEKARKAIQEYEDEKKSEAAAAAAAASSDEGSAAAESYATAPSAHSAADASVEQTSVQQQQTLMDESGKMLEYLRKEVFKLRSQNTQMRTDFDLLKDNNQRLMDANASAGASFAALNQHAKYLTKTNEKLTGEVVACKQQVQKLSVTQVELKEELKMKQATYMAEILSRLQYQKSLAKIVDIVQEQCRDSRLVETILGIADECEAEYMDGSTEAPPATPASDGPGANSNAPAEGSGRNASSNTGLMASFRSLFS